jgi:acetylglutamate kinase
VKLLVKVGGSLLDDPSSRNAMARQLATVAHEHEHELVVVHGGGKQVTRFLEQRGVTSRFVRGLRVSDEPVIDAVTKVIAGTVNKHLVSAILATGQMAVGLSGVDGLLTSAVPLDPDLGAVGKPAHTDARLLDLLVNAGYLPVVACIAGDKHGNTYNVNADQMAVSCAVGWQADKLLFLTDVPGVKDQNGQVLPHLTSGEITGLIESGVAHGGMQAKLEAAQSALLAGLSEVIIAPGHEPDVCINLLGGAAIGTRLARTSPTAKEMQA